MLLRYNLSGCLNLESPIYMVLLPISGFLVKGVYGDFTALGGDFKARVSSFWVDWGEGFRLSGVGHISTSLGFSLVRTYKCVIVQYAIPKNQRF